MKKAFELLINGKFSQYLKPSEVKLIKWEEGLSITLVPVMITFDKWKFAFGICS